MPQFTIKLSAKALAGLQAMVERNNADSGRSLTVGDWLTLHVKELLITEELARSAENLRQQAERDANAALDAALRAEKDRLLREL